MHYSPALLPKVRSEPLMEAIADMPCTLRVSSFYPGHSCASAATVVGCHLDSVGKGMSTKSTDLAVVAGCLNCHAILDGVDTKRHAYIAEKYPTAFESRLRAALIETHAMLIQRGIIQVKGMVLL